MNENQKDLASAPVLEETSSPAIAAIAPSNPATENDAAHMPQDKPDVEPSSPEKPAGMSEPHEQLAHLQHKIEAFSQQLTLLYELCASGFSDDRQRDETVLSLHKKLEQFEREAVRLAKEALLRDLLLFYDSLLKLEEQSCSGALPAETFAQEISWLRAELLEIFSTHKMARLDLPGNGKYDSRLQKAVRVENTNDNAEHETVARLVRDGFVWEERVLRKQEVVVKKFIYISGRNES